MKLQDFIGNRIDEKEFREEVIDCYRKYVNPATVDMLAMAVVSKQV